MKAPFDFFFVPKEYLEIDDIDVNVQHLFDKVASLEFYKAISAIAERYNIDYVLTRTCVIKVKKSQPTSTLNLYAICKNVFEGDEEDNWAARHLILRVYLMCKLYLRSKYCSLLHRHTGKCKFSFRTRLKQTNQYAHFSEVSCVEVVVGCPRCFYPPSV